MLSALTAGMVRGLGLRSRGQAARPSCRWASCRARLVEASAGRLRSKTTEGRSLLQGNGSHPYSVSGGALCAAVTTDRRVAVVQGASRGIGLEFVKQLLDRPHCEVVATCRTPGSAQELINLQAVYPNRLNIVALDLLDTSSIQAAVDEISQRHSHVDVLLNVSAVLHIPGKMTPETAMARIDAENMLLSFQTNAIGPMLTCQAFLPMLAAAEHENKATQERPAVIANLSARVGSIGDNKLGGWYSYRGSKAALNQMTRTMSIEIERRKQKVACLLLHPGTTKTDLSGPFQKNVKPEMLFPVERTVSQLLSIIDAASMEDNGRFVAWDGKDIVW